MTALAIIEDFYGDKLAKRSSIPLIDHIHAGLNILDELDVDSTVKDAWCIHPIIQSDKDMMIELKAGKLNALDNSSAIILAMEYRVIANTYLSPDTDAMSDIEKDEFKKLVENNQMIRHMLIADKVQNYRAFRIQPLGTYENEVTLHRYFTDWIFNILGLSTSEHMYYEELITK